MKTYYALIGVAASAAPEEIKRAFRREIARYHPDKVQHLGQEFQEIAAARAAELTEAYRILMDPAARQKYDEDLADGITPPAAPRSAAPAAARPEPAPAAECYPPQTPGPEAFQQTRATISDFVRKATLKRFGEAAAAVCDATSITVAGFDAGYVCQARRGLFKKSEPPLRLLTRIVPAVDAGTIVESWPLALKASAADDTLCIMLMGQGMAPAGELAAAIAEQRRKSRNAGPTLIPVDFRDWDALFPPDTPAVARAVVERLRQGDR